MDSWSALERVRDGHTGDPDDLIYCDGSGDGGIDLACLRRAEPARVSRPPRLTLRYPPHRSWLPRRARSPNLSSSRSKVGRKERLMRRAPKARDAKNDEGAHGHAYP